MKYTAASFTVPASGKAPEDCKHGWVAKNRCVLCGGSVGYAVGLFRVGETTTLIEATEPPVTATVTDATEGTLTVSLT